MTTTTVDDAYCTRRGARRRGAGRAYGRLDKEGVSLPIVHRRRKWVAATVRSSKTLYAYIEPPPLRVSHAIKRTREREKTRTLCTVSNTIRCGVARLNMYTYLYGECVVVLSATQCTV